MARILLLLSRTSYRAAAFMQAAERLGVDVTVGSNHRQVVAELAPGAAISLDLADPSRALPRILASDREHPLDAVIAAEDEGSVLAAVAADALKLPHNPPDAVRAARFKHLARARLEPANVSVPEYHVFGPGHIDAAAAAERVPYPCVIKPVGLSASRGVIRADAPADFVPAFERAAALAANQPEPDAAGTVLVERYIPGVEVALEGLLTHGELRVLAIFDKPDPMEGPFFEETLYVTPSRLPHEVLVTIVETASRCAQALGLRHGPLHAEFRHNPEGVWPLELAPRSIGGLCSRVLRFEGDVALEEVLLRHALGADIGEPRLVAPADGVMMLPIPRAGVLRQVRGIDAARAVPGIEDVVITATRGQEILPLPEGNRYLGFAFARGGDPAFVEAALRTAERLLDYVIEPAA